MLDHLAQAVGHLYAAALQLLQVCFSPVLIDASRTIALLKIWTTFSG